MKGIVFQCTIKSLFLAINKGEQNWAADIKLQFCLVIKTRSMIWFEDILGLQNVLLDRKQDLCKNPRIELTTFYYLFHYLHNIFFTFFFARDWKLLIFENHFSNLPIYGDFILFVTLAQTLLHQKTFRLSFLLKGSFRLTFSMYFSLYVRDTDSFKTVKL